MCAGVVRKLEGQDQGFPVQRASFEFSGWSGHIKNPSNLATDMPKNGLVGGVAQNSWARVFRKSPVHIALKMSSSKSCQLMPRYISLGNSSCSVCRIGEEFDQALLWSS